MALRLLQDNSVLSIFHDADYEWLYLDWRGELTRPAVQQALLLVLRTCLSRPYARVLNSTAQVTGVAWDVPPWLAHTLSEGLPLMGVEQLAWVYAPFVRGRSMAERIADQLRHLNLALFADAEQAVTWLGQTRTALSTVGPRPTAAQARLQWVVQVLEQELATYPA